MWVHISPIKPTETITMTGIYIDTPFLSVDEYARRTGMTRSVVVRMCRDGDLPTRRRKSDSAPYYVNNALLIKKAIESEY